MGGAYAASLCWGGITGGCLLIQPGGLLFTTQKIQVPKDKRRIFIPFADLRAVGRSRVLGFPAVRLETEARIGSWRKVFISSSFIICRVGYKFEI